MIDTKATLALLGVARPDCAQDAEDLTPWAPSLERPIEIAARALARERYPPAPGEALDEGEPTAGDEPAGPWAAGRLVAALATGRGFPLVASPGREATRYALVAALCALYAGGSATADREAARVRAEGVIALAITGLCDRDHSVAEIACRAIAELIHREAPPGASRSVCGAALARARRMADAVARAAGL